MRTIVIYWLLLTTLLPTFSQWGIIAHYQLNKAYIARVLCQNRDKPQLHCDGQCYLAKQLKARQDKQDKETTERVQSTPVLHLFCQPHVPFLFRPTWVSLVLANFFSYHLASPVACVTSLFRPPKR
ncbi:hypothetical protein SD10_24435 [Spirosoma radiotolerans]|uniref:Uncharacterized protein n=1 Tax=Spirosoma radiotolerans TaxID=1379870 RepID=A0A0E4A1W2_9BACT|nr:hypothetical protein SD10_24435 [Spirosoma radiotolerans]